MANTSAPVTAAPLSKEAALANILKANDVALATAGKRGYNPYFYINNVLVPLKAKVEGGVTEAIVQAQSMPMPGDAELRVVEDTTSALAPVTDNEAAANVSSSKGLARVLPVKPQ